MAAAIIGARHGKLLGQQQAELARQQAVSLHRLQAREKTKREQEMVKALLEKYDKDGNQGLDRNELKPMLCDYSLESLGRTERVTEEDLDFLIALVQRRGGNEDGLVKGSEITAACETWYAWLERGPKIDAFICRFDENKNGQLEKEELNAFLLHLNKGKPFPPEILDYVMDQADFTKTGTLSRMEVARAVAVWYMWSGHDVTGKAAQRNRLNGYIDRTKLQGLPAKNVDQGCCTIS
jgi:Ca2+-binding EF-hand superfamily protein